MSGKTFPSNTMSQARSMLDAWMQVNENMVFQDLNITHLRTKVDGYLPLEQQIINAENMLTDLRNQRDELLQDIWEDVKRARSGVKSFYGDDSPQYELFGGTRKSDRKPPVRKAKTSA